MLSPETLQSYREMTPGQRLELTLESLRINEPFLLFGAEDLVARRFELLEKQNNERNEAMLRQLSKTSKRQAKRSENDKAVQ